ALSAASERGGCICYAARGELADRHIQVSNMGELPDATIDAFLAAVTDVVRSARAATPSAVRALRSVYPPRRCAPPFPAATAGPRSWKWETSRRRRPARARCRF